MIDVRKYQYNAAEAVWCILFDGVVQQCFRTEQEAREAADELSTFEPLDSIQPE